VNGTGFLRTYRSWTWRPLIVAEVYENKDEIHDNWSAVIFVSYSIKLSVSNMTMMTFWPHTSAVENVDLSYVKVFIKVPISMGAYATVPFPIFLWNFPNWRLVEFQGSSEKESLQQKLESSRIFGEYPSTWILHALYNHISMSCS